MSEAHDAHVIDKCRIEGDRHGEEVFYLVGPTRQSQDEAREDLARYREADCLAGQVAALRKELEVLADADCDRDDGIECIKFDPRSTEYCAICRAKTALASGAGEREAKVLRAVRLLAEAERRCSAVGVGVDMDAEFSATSVPGAYRALLDAADALRADRKETG